LRDVSNALADDDPLGLLQLVSAMLAALDPRDPNPFDPTVSPLLPTRDELIETFLEVDAVETSALLAVIGELSGEQMLRRRIRRECAARSHALPAWLTDLHRAQVVAGAAGVVEVVHVLGDGDNVLVGVRLPGGHDVTATIYIDHNMGTVVKDAFVVDLPTDQLVEQMLTMAADPDTEARELSPADARARITDAIDKGSIMFPPLESETWPACRPLVQWMVALLPEGGTGYERPEWDDKALAALIERFLASRFGAGLDDADHRGLLESLLWFGTDYGPGDPLRWSPPAVEVLLEDWIPRKIVAEAAFLAKAPDLLRAFIRFCHHERGIRADLTRQTIEAVDECEPEYQRVIRSARPQGPAALLAALGVLDPESPWAPDHNDFLDEPIDFHEIMLDTLRRAVGGEGALDGLSAAALPDEAFAWDGIPDDIRDRVDAVLVLVDRCCGELLDTEYRTACRRFLSRAAAGDPEIFRRRGRADTAAAAVCWVIGKANMLFQPGIGRRSLLVKDLMSHFGMGQSTASQRSGPLLRAISVNPDQYGAMDLGSPDYLTSSRREGIIALREHYRAMGEE
jgi:hypothetical protein